jgi:multiple sugar transport system permease protein
LWAKLAAAAMVAMAPVIVLGIMAQRHIVKGLTVGAVKGGGRR